MIKLKILFSLWIFLFSNNLYSQATHSPDIHSHIRYKNEFAIANSPVYFLKGKAWGYGIHIHYIRNISDRGFGLGASFEKILGILPHNTLGLITAYRPIEQWSLSIAPSLTFEDVWTSPTFALHFETTYDVFEIKNIDIGPAFELGLESEGIHLSLGVHVCFCF